MKKKILVVISDVGYGHYSRQKAIIDQLLKVNNISITVATSNSLKLLKEIYGSKIKYFKFNTKFNLVKKDGILNKTKSIKRIKSYLNSIRS